MGKIKKLLENELVGGTQSSDVYPVTSVKAVYDEDNESLDHILKGVKQQINKLSINKLKKIPILDYEVCNKGARYIDIENLILDLEIISDSDKLFAPVVFDFDGTENFYITFFEVNESGQYLLTFNNFILRFNSKDRKLLYILDKQVTSSSKDYTAKVSIAIDSSSFTSNLDAYSPSLVSSECKKEHWGLISILRQITSNSDKLIDLSSELKNIDIKNVSNGKKIIYCDTSHIQPGYSIITNITDNSFVISTSKSDNVWCYTKPAFTPKGNNYVHIKFNLKCLTPELLEEGATDSVGLWLSNGSSSYSVDGCKYVGTYRDGDEIKYSFDPAYYSVYKEWTEFGVWVSINSGINKTVKWQITNFEVYELDGRVNGLEGENLKEVLDDASLKISDLDEKISGVSSVDTELISPSGNRFELSVQDNGTLIAIPIVPSKGAMFGNSLIGGSGFGMAASDNEHDYFYLITEAIKTLNPSYTSTRLTALQTGSFEALTSEGEIDAAVKKMTDALTGDEDLVSIQLGDNVNTPEKNVVFPKSSLALCKAMRAKCPKARIAWMGMWYGSTEKYEAIKNACEKTGCKFISFQDILGSEANSKIGNVQKLNSSAQRTVTNVTNVTENMENIIQGTKVITVDFTVGDISYTSILEVTDYSLQDGNLSYTSNYSIITNGGVASHPGDEGFRRISNRFLYEMKLTDDQEYYKKSE